MAKSLIDLSNEMREIINCIDEEETKSDLLSKLSDIDNELQTLIDVKRKVDDALDTLKDLTF